MEEESEGGTEAAVPPRPPAAPTAGKSVRFLSDEGSGGDDVDVDDDDLLVGAKGDDHREEVEEDDFDRDGRGRRGGGEGVKTTSSSSSVASERPPTTPTPDDAELGLTDAPTAPSSDGGDEDEDDEEGKEETVCSKSTTASSSSPDDGATTTNLTIEPPPSHIEKFRDTILSILNHRLKVYFGLIVLFIIIIDGAFFFFLLVGWQGMCSYPSRTDCEPRNFWYNVSIQILNGCFTYAATVTLPWRLSNLANLWPWCFRHKRKCGVGLDLYGIPTDEIWFHIPPKKRRRIIVLLLGNTFTQYANQATRIVYYNYELSSEMPGSFWTNVFFVSSMALAAAGGFVQLRAETKLRKSKPDEFPPGPIDLIKKYLPKWWREWWKKHKERRRRRRKARGRDDDAEEDDGRDRIEEGKDEEDNVQPEEDRTAGHRDRLERSMHLLHKHSTARIVTFYTSLMSWWNNDRHSLGLWGL